MQKCEVVKIEAIVRGYITGKFNLKVYHEALN